MHFFEIRNFFSKFFSSSFLNSTGNAGLFCQYLINVSIQDPTFVTPVLGTTYYHDTINARMNDQVSEDVLKNYVKHQM